MFNVKQAVAAALAVAAITGGGAAAAVQASAAARPVRTQAAHVVDVTASEFSYSVRTHGRVPAGLVELRLANHGTVDHEALLGRLHRGVTLAAFAQALKKSGPAAFGLIDAAGGTAPVAAHGGQVTWQALQGGNYVVLCLVAGPDGIPHVMKGMLAGFTVAGHLTRARLAALHPAGKTAGTIAAHDMTFTLPAVIRGHGLYRFANTDRTDVHELGLIRLNKGVTAADVVAWVKSPAGPPPFTSAGGFGATVPGHGGWLQLDLRPGRYAAICYVFDNSSGAPHAALGMVVPFAVSR